MTPMNLKPLQKFRLGEKNWGGGVVRGKAWLDDIVYVRTLYINRIILLKIQNQLIFGQSEDTFSMRANKKQMLAYHRER